MRVMMQIVLFLVDKTEQKIAEPNYQLAQISSTVADLFSEMEKVREELSKSDRESHDPNRIKQYIFISKNNYGVKSGKTNNNHRIEPSKTNNKYRA